MSTFKKSNFFKLSVTAAAITVASLSFADTNTVNEADRAAQQNRAKEQIVNLNANFNSFESSRDYDNFIQSRSKLLQRNANDNLRDVSVEAQPVDENSIEIKQFKFVSENNISFSVVKKLEQEAAKYNGQRFTARKIAALKNNLNNILIRAGYVTSIVYIRDQDFANGELVFNIKWGLVNSIYVNKTQEDHDSFKNRAMLTTVPSFYKDVLRISTIDQIVENLTTPNKDVRIDVAPAPNRKDYTDIVINSHRTLKPNFSAAINNANDKDQLQLSLSATAGDLLGINDTWTLSYLKRLMNRMDQRHTDIVTLRLDQPLGFFNLSVNNQLVRFKNTNSAINGFTKVYAPSFKTDWKLSYVTFRDKTRIVNVFASIDYRTGETDVSYADAQGKRLTQILNTTSKSTNLKVGANYLNNAFYNGRLFVEGSYVQGLGLFSGDKSADPVNGVNTDYAKYLTFYANYNRNFEAAAKLWNYQITAQGQYSLNKYNSSGVYYGGAYDVRGLRKDAVAGQHGFALTTQVGPQFQLDYRYLRSVNPYVGLDFAYAYTPEYTYNGQTATEKVTSGSSQAFSAVLGVALAGPSWRVSTNVGVPFGYGNVNDKKAVDKYNVYFNASTNF